jgi:hypothetical protein
VLTNKAARFADYASEDEALRGERGDQKDLINNGRSRRRSNAAQVEEQGQNSASKENSERIISR